MFNNREVSTVIWVAVLFAWALFNDTTRKSVRNLLRAFFKLQILAMIGISLLYSIGLIYILSLLSLTTETVLKDASLWFGASAFVILMNARKAAKEKNHFKEIIRENVKIVLIFEFLVNIHSFSLVAELIMMPFIVLIALVQTYANTKAEYKAAGTFTKYLIATTTIILLYLSARDIFVDSDKFIRYETLKSFLFPIILTIGFIPAAYLLAVYMDYEQLFIVLSYKIKDNRELKRVKWPIVKKCKASLNKLRNLRNAIQQIGFNPSPNEIRIFLQEL